MYSPGETLFNGCILFLATFALVIFYFKSRVWSAPRTQRWLEYFSYNRFWLLLFLQCLCRFLNVGWNGKYGSLYTLREYIIFLPIHGFYGHCCRSFLALHFYVDEMVVIHTPVLSMWIWWSSMSAWSIYSLRLGAWEIHLASNDIHSYAIRITVGYHHGYRREHRKRSSLDGDHGDRSSTRYSCTPRGSWLCLEEAQEQGRRSRFLIASSLCTAQAV